MNAMTRYGRRYILVANQGLLERERKRQEGV